MDIDILSTRRRRLIVGACVLGALATVVLGWRRRRPGAPLLSADGSGPEPPPDDLSRDPAYEPPEPLKDIKGG